MRMSKLIIGTGLLAVLAVPAAAQSNPSVMPESYRQVQENALALQRRMLLAMVDSMPERFYREKASPAQRDFAGQIEHAAGSVRFIATRFLAATGAPQADSAKYLNTRAGMRDFVNGIYDWATSALRNQSAENRAKTVNLMGKEMPAWQVWDEIHQHTIWTAGQLVANFRAHNMAPPGFAFF